MAIINIHGSVWGGNDASVFLIIVTNLTTNRAYYLESDEDETIKTCFDSRRYQKGVLTLRDKYKLRIERLMTYRYSKDGDFEESYDALIPEQKAIGLGRLQSFFDDECGAQLRAIWNTLVMGQSSELEKASDAKTAYSIQTKHSSLGTW
jgi:hypothetical protein